MEATWAIWSLDSVSLAMALERLDRRLDAGLDAPLERHRVGPGGHVAQALVDHGPGQHGGGGGAVTGDVVGLLGDFLDQLGADLLPRVLEVDLLGDGDPVVGDGGGAPLLLEHDVAALRAEGDAYGVGELVHAVLEGPAGLLVEGDQLGHGVVSSVVTCSGYRGGVRRGRGARVVPGERPGALSSVSTLRVRVLTANHGRGRATGPPTPRPTGPADRRRLGQPPATAGTMERVWPSATAVSRPSRKRTSSSARKTFTKRRRAAGLVEEPVAEARVGGVEGLQDLAHRRPLHARPRPRRR